MSRNTYNHFRVGRFKFLVIAMGLAIAGSAWWVSDPNGPGNDREMLHLGAQYGDLSMIQLALSRHVQVDTPDEQQLTPLMIAARAGKADAVRYLLARGANVNANVPVFGTALMLAAACGRHDVLRELIARGANVNSVNPTGQTALWYARLTGDDETARILTASGAVAEGHFTTPREGEVIEQDADIRTPSETRAIKTADLAVPASATGSERRSTSVQSAQ